MMVTSGDPADFTLRVSFQGKPYPEDAIESVQYLLFDGSGSLARRGTLSAAADGTWPLRLEPEELAALGSGANSLELAVISRLVALPSFASQVFATVPTNETPQTGGSP
jgi:peptide/nickel transport system substrate-binding protein